MKKAVSMVLAMILIILMTIVAASIAYHWMTEIQSEMQSGTSRYQEELTEQVTGRLHVVDFQYDIGTKDAKIVLENSGRRKLEDVGSPTDYLVLVAETTSCHTPFNSTTCNSCPFDLDVNEVTEVIISFANYECDDVAKGAEYTANFILKEGQTQSSFVPVEKYNEWSRKLPVTTPSARHSHVMATVYGTDKVVLYGGDNLVSTCDGVVGGYCNGTWTYDYSDDDWTFMNATLIAYYGHTGRYGSGAAVLDGTNRVVLYGGFGVTREQDTYTYNYSKDKWIQMSPATTPHESMLHAMATIGGTDKVMLYGGELTCGIPPCDCDGSGVAYCNGTWVYDYSDDDWTRMDTAVGLGPREKHAMATIDGTDKILLFGGDQGSGTCDNTGSSICNSTWVYDYSDDNWTRMSPDAHPSARHSHAMAARYGTDKVVLFGGYDGSTARSDTWMYDYNENNWTKMNHTTKPDARYSHAMASIYGTDGVIIFGGQPINNDTWIYI